MVEITYWLHEFKWATHCYNPHFFIFFFYALLAFNMKPVSFTRGLHLAVSSVERSIFPWPGSKGTVITVVIAALELDPLSGALPDIFMAPDSWSSFLLAANPHILSCFLKSSLCKSVGKPLAAAFALKTAVGSSETWLLKASHVLLFRSQ